MESIFFWLSKLVWLVISPDSLLLLLILFAWAMCGFRKDRLARKTLSVVSISLLVIALAPVNEWLLYPLENRFPANPALPAKIDGIIVLSGGENAIFAAAWKQPEFGGAAERDLTFLKLARQYPDAKLLFTGGSGNMLVRDYSGADVARTLFEQEGLNIARITFDSKSRNTHESAALSKALVKPAAGENWILITSAFHMPRSLGIFCKIDWPVIPYPVDHNTWRGNLFRIELNLADHLLGVRTAVHEWIGLGAYYATGKTTALLPLDCR
jgi:uncharacterized SAM-binding protein YcdF (DUF218 family)